MKVIKKLEELKDIDSKEELSFDIEENEDYSTSDINDYASFHWDNKLTIKIKANAGFETIKRIIEFETFLLKHSVDTSIDYSDIFQSEEIISFIDKYKSNTYSPLEKCLATYSKCVMAIEDEAFYHRNALLMQLLLKELGITSYLYRCIHISYDKYDTYTLAIVLKDEKYHIDGLYESNPNHFKDDSQFANFLYPLTYSHTNYYFIHYRYKEARHYDDLLFFTYNKRSNRLLIDLPFLLDINSSILNTLLPIQKDKDKLNKEAEEIYEKNVVKGANNLLEVLLKRDFPFTDSDKDFFYIEATFSTYFLLAYSSIYPQKELEDYLDNEFFMESHFDSGRESNIKVNGHNSKEVINEVINNPISYQDKEEIINRIAKILYINELQKALVNSPYIKPKAIPIDAYKTLFDYMANDIELDLNERNKPLSALPFVIFSMYGVGNSTHFLHQEIYAEKIEDIEIKHANFFNDLNYVDIILDFDNYPIEVMKEVIEKANNIKAKGYLPFICINAVYKNFNEEEINNFKIVRTLLNEHGYELYFDGNIKNTYTLDELINADTTLDVVINKANNPSLSQFEKFLVIYNFLISKPYNLGGEMFENENTHAPRDIISTINGKTIVCTGYSELMYYLCKEVGIKCFIQVIDTPELHQNNLVYIKDDKYHIDGLYYTDSCWDSIHIKYNSPSYLWCLLPMNDRFAMDQVPTPFSELILLSKAKCDYVYFAERSCYSELLTAIENDNVNSYLFDIKDRSYFRSLFEEAKELTATRYEEAYNELMETFDKYKIPLDVYDLEYVIWGTSYYYLLALQILNDPKVETNVASLSEYYKQYKNDELAAPHKFINYYSDRYSIGNSDYQYMKLGSQKFTSHIIKMISDIVFAIKVTKVVSEEIDNYPYAKHGKPLDIETYQNALHEVFKLDGLEEEEINKLIEKRINLSIELSIYNFYENAKNIFRKQYLEKYHE